jgi:predicted nucleic acid-binding protein
MKYLFDSSAIFGAIKENRIDLLIGNYTLELARFELGNIVWKDYFLQAKISKDEAKMILKAIKHALALMEVIPIEGNAEEILESAIQMKTTFYDASYVCLARIKELKLITEDLHLIKKAMSAIKVSVLNDIEK